MSCRTQLNVAIATQLEGAGHLTQALAIQKMLHQYFNINICCYVLNSLKQDTIPQYFLKAISKSYILWVPGPIYIRQQSNQAVSGIKTVLHTFGQAIEYSTSLLKIDECFKKLNIDIIINLFDYLMVWYMQRYQPYNVVLINIATQFKSQLNFECNYSNQQMKNQVYENSIILLSDKNKKSNNNSQQYPQQLNEPLLQSNNIVNTIISFFIFNQNQQIQEEKDLNTNKPQLLDVLKYYKCNLFLQTALQFHNPPVIKLEINEKQQISTLRYYMIALSPFHPPEFNDLGQKKQESLISSVFNCIFLYLRYIQRILYNIIIMIKTIRIIITIRIIKTIIITIKKLLVYKVNLLHFMLLLALFLKKS